MSQSNETHARKCDFLRNSHHQNAHAANDYSWLRLYAVRCSDRCKNNHIRVAKEKEK